MPWPSNPNLLLRRLHGGAEPPRESRSAPSNLSSGANETGIGPVLRRFCCARFSGDSVKRRAGQIERSADSTIGARTCPLVPDSSEGGPAKWLKIKNLENHSFAFEPGGRRFETVQARELQRVRSGATRAAY